MKALQWLAVGCIVGMVGTGAFADDKPDYAKLIVGKWEVSKAPEGNVPEGSVVEFTKDGKMKVTAKKDDADSTVEGTYKIEGDAFVMTFKRGEESVTRTITITKITDTEMSTKNQEGTVVELKKKK